MRSMALVGDNGAGKSTLIKGDRRHLPVRRGQVRYEGAEVNIRGPADAGTLGIEIVYQDLALADNLDVVANMFLGRERPAGRAVSVLDEADMERRRQSDPATGSRSPPSSSVRRSWPVLSGGQRQAVAVAKVRHVGVQGRHPRRAHGGARAWPRPARSSTSSAAWRNGASAS